MFVNPTTSYPNWASTVGCCDFNLIPLRLEQIVRLSVVRFHLSHGWALRGKRCVGIISSLIPRCCIKMSRVVDSEAFVVSPESYLRHDIFYRWASRTNIPINRKRFPQHLKPLLCASKCHDLGTTRFFCTIPYNTAQTGKVESGLEDSTWFIFMWLITHDDVPVRKWAKKYMDVSMRIVTESANL